MVSSDKVSIKLFLNSFWFLGGIFLVGLSGVIVLLSRRFDPSIPLSEQPILILVALMVVASTIYLFTIKKIPDLHKTKLVLVWIFAIGFIMRMGMISSTPILEVDFNRYLWDGAVTANGLNPYQYAPEEIQNTDSISQNIPVVYTKLAEESGGILGNINHAYLKTVYPPVTQIVFAAAYLLNPWDFNAWRFLLLICDLIILLLLYKLFLHLKLSPFWLVIYWWNPLLIKEIFNSGHMDVLLYPFILVAILMYLQNKELWATFLLAVAVGVKLWPILLLPFFLKKQISEPKKLIISLALFGVIVLIVLAPMYLAGFDDKSGLMNYGARWQLNDGIFKLLVWGSQFFLQLVGVHPGFKYAIARYVVFFLMIVWLIYLMQRKQKRPNDFVDLCLWLVVGLFFLSPTQFPWYSLWLLPFLTIRPRLSLLLLNVTMPLYYLRYYFEARGMTGIYDIGIVWIEYLPVWILLGYEIYCSVKKKPQLLFRIPAANEI